MRTNCSITVYNRYISGGAEAYQRTQVKDVAWVERKGANVRAMGGLLGANQATVYIPHARGANYLDPIAWLAGKTGKWTLQVGDYIVRGLVTDEVSAGFSITALKAKYDHTLSVTSVDYNNLGSVSLWHWQVGLL